MFCNMALKNIIEIDSKVIADLINSELMIDNAGLILLKDIRRLLRSHFKFKVQHNFRKGNRSADRFANFEINKRLDTRH